jgi:DNA primase
MKSSDAEDYITNLLHELNCRGIKPTNTGDIHCQCPYHRPRHNVTAFGISFTREDKGYPFHCLSCKEKGNLAQLVSMAYGCSYKRAVKLITKNIALKPITIKRLSEDLIKLSDLSRGAVKQTRIDMPTRSGNQKAMMRYLKKRKRKGRDVMNVPYIANKYGLYYCGDGRMAGRIIMPIRINGKVVGINDRAVNESLRNKSLHIADQEYNELLHGLDEAVGKRTAVLVEGSFDMFQGVSAVMTKAKICKRYGFVNNMGTAFSEVKAALLLENFDDLVLMFDNDIDNNDGFEGALKWYKEMKDMMPVRNVTTEYPKGKDPAICTAPQIIDAITSEGYKPKTSLQRMKSGSMIKL